MYRTDFYGRVVEPTADRRCGYCAGAAFNDCYHAEDGTRGYRCIRCGHIKPEREPLPENVAQHRGSWHDEQIALPVPPNPHPKMYFPAGKTWLGEGD